MTNGMQCDVTSLKNTEMQYKPTKQAQQEKENIVTNRIKKIHVCLKKEKRNSVKNTQVKKKKEKKKKKKKKKETKQGLFQSVRTYNAQ